MNQVLTDAATVVGFAAMVAGAGYFGTCVVLGAAESYKNWRMRVANKPLAVLEPYGFSVDFKRGTALRHSTRGDEELIEYQPSDRSWVALRCDWGDACWATDPQPTPLAAYAAAELVEWGR